MLRALVASLLLLAGLAALVPHASAVYICQSSTFLSDLDPDDDDPYIADAHCSTENLISYTCKAQVTLWDGGSVTRTTSCEPLICPTDYCYPQMASAAAAQPPCGTAGDPFLDAGFGVTCTAGPATCSAATATFGTVEEFLSPDAGCSVPFGPCELGPVVSDGRPERFLVECGGLIVCVTEPCPGSDPIKV